MEITFVTHCISNPSFTFRKIDDDHRCHLLLLLVFEMSDVYIPYALRDKSSSFIFINISTETGS